MNVNFNEWFNGQERLNTQFDDWFKDGSDELYDEKKEREERDDQYYKEADEDYDRKRAFE